MVATSLSDHNCHLLTMKRINVRGATFQQTSTRIHENAYLLVKGASIPISEAAEQGVIAARTWGVEI